MTSQKIQNPKTPVPETPQMNERDFLNDVLTTEKYFNSSYSIALNEMSHQSLYQSIAMIAQESEQMQRQLYDLMFKKGWYGFDQAEAASINQTYQQFSGYKNQFPYSQGTPLQ